MRRGGYVGGISFYDGTKWTTLSSKKEYRIPYYNILVGPGNKKYFLSWDGNNNYSYDGGNWTTFDNIPRGAAIDQNGIFWFTRNDTLFKYQNGIVSSYKVPRGGGVSSHIAIGPDNGVWFTVDYNYSGVFSDSIIVTKFKDGIWKFFQYSIRNLEITYNIQKNRQSDAKIAVESTDKVWIASSGTGLFSCDTKSGGIWNNYNPYNSDIGIAFIGTVLIDNFGNKWITSANAEGTIVEFNENGIITAVHENGEQAIEQPKDFMILQNFPNPFNPTTTINYALPQAGNVTLKVYDMLGREVATLVNEYKNAGYYQANFDAGKLSSGVYFYTLQAGKFVETKKLVLMK